MVILIGGENLESNKIKNILFFRKYILVAMQILDILYEITQNSK